MPHKKKQMTLRQQINKHFDTLETIFMLIFATGMVFIVKEITGAKQVIIAATAGFVILYWFKSTERIENEHIKLALSRKLVWYSMMILPIAIYSKLNLYPNSDKFLIFAISISSIALIIRIIQKIKKTAIFNNTEIIRLIIAIILGFALYALPLPQL